MSRFKIWNGVDSGSAGEAGDTYGFEHVPSVTKTTFQRYEFEDEEEEEPISAQVPRSRKTIGEVRPIFVLTGTVSSPLTLNDGPRNNNQSPLRTGRLAHANSERSPGTTG